MLVVGLSDRQIYNACFRCTFARQGTHETRAKTSPDVAFDPDFSLQSDGTVSNVASARSGHVLVEHQNMKNLIVVIHVQRAIHAFD